MKLVEILARELKEWPSKECLAVTQDHSKEVYGWSDKPFFENKDWLVTETANVTDRVDKKPFRLASDYKTAIVTRADWEAERARIAKPANKADKHGWIRHHGGKCPVEAGVLVDVRLRCGELYAGADAEPAGFWTWGRSKQSEDGGDIMAYRLHKPAEQPVNMQADAECAAVFGDSHADVMESVLSRLDGPLQWRDRITEIDRTVEALEKERASLIQRLADEGLQLLQGKVCGSVQPVEDWKVSAVTDGKYIQAIKEHRNLCGSGLKEAKRAVDDYRDAHRPST